MFRVAAYDAPFGGVTLEADGDHLTGLRYGAPPGTRTLADPDDALLVEAIDQLDAYFAGDRRTFDLPLRMPDVSAFDAAVYRAMSAIPYGELASYGDLAAEAGSPRGARAVGGACNRNPLSIVIPCHRVVAANGSLGGYGAGLDVKRALLELERPGEVPRGGWPPASVRLPA